MYFALYIFLLPIPFLFTGWEKVWIFFFIFTFSETGGLIFAYWEFSFQFSNHKHGMAATIKKYTLENSKGFSVKNNKLESVLIVFKIQIYC